MLNPYIVSITLYVEACSHEEALEQAQEALSITGIEAEVDGVTAA